MNRDRATAVFALTVILAATVFAAHNGSVSLFHTSGVLAPAPGLETRERGVPGAGNGMPRTTRPETNLREREAHRLRVKKCERLVRQLYPNSGFMPYVEFFVQEHERLGMAEAWWDSITYGGANFSLQVGGRAPGNCAGPMDVKHSPMVLDPKKNIEWHCREMKGFYDRGVRGRDLCEHIFLPGNPRDWQVRNSMGRFARTEARHLTCIERGYRYGKLP